jgi:hypothetical protein
MIFVPVAKSCLWEVNKCKMAFYTSQKVVGIIVPKRMGREGEINIPSTK